MMVHTTFTPENVMEIQRSIGAIMAFDECTPYPCDYNYAKRSMKMTHRWLDRCVNHLEKVPVKYGYDQSIFSQCLKFTRLVISRIYSKFKPSRKCYGGLSVGEPAEEMYAMTRLCSFLRINRVIMGVGTPLIF
jgi:queuine tRNA-ribosyltransferase